MRPTAIPDEVKSNYLKIANDFGYNTSELLWIKHDRQQE